MRLSGAIGAEACGSGADDGDIHLAYFHACVLVESSVVKMSEPSRVAWLLESAGSMPRSKVVMNLIKIKFLIAKNDEGAAA
ncbi:hypothetical protein GCM10027512_15770 [Chromohalobacter beijerinckii]